MAFRATKTSSKSSRTKKPSEKTIIEEKVKMKTTALSVDDVVGAPAAESHTNTINTAPEHTVAGKMEVGDKTNTPEEKEKKSAIESTNDTSTFIRPQTASVERPRHGYERGGYSRGYQNYRRNPYNHTARFGGRGYQDNAMMRGVSDRPRREGYEGGYHREWNNDSGSFTQDVNVPTETVRGILDIMPEGHGFLRPKFTPSDRDVYISQSQIRRFMLRNGDMVEGQARQPKDNERYWGLLKVEKVNEQEAEGMSARPRFEDLVPIYPNKHLHLETGQTPLSTRMIDLVAPIGFGQRGMIVSPPKAGKTTILKEIAAGISANYPDVHLMAALIGERPEEVTDLTRSIKGEVLASNFDESPSEQTRVAEVALDRAKRLVEMGKDVVILLDSVTRLARAYNLVVNPSGRTLSGGFDPAALYPAKKFLGAARCVEKTATGDKKKEKEKTDEETGGSLTVIGTALVDTGSRMDDLIYEEFKGTGNMELHLSRALQERRIFPAIDVGKSGTRHDELLLGESVMKRVVTLRHMLSLLSDEERTMMLVERLSKTKSNSEFLESLSQG
jgi:transcription termination factor Rho